MARQRWSSGWRRLGHEVGDDARGGPIGPECWVQSKNGPEYLMGHPARGGPRWARPEKGKENRKSYGLQRSTFRIEMGCEKIPSQILNQGFGFKENSFKHFQSRINSNILLKIFLFKYGTFRN
jgi:hypothetical protein